MIAIQTLKVHEMCKANKYTAIVLFLTMLGILVEPARAEFFVWKDQETGISLSFPDTWAIANNQKPDDIFTIQAPGERDYASCRMRVREDRRVTIYPYQYDFEIQHIYAGFDFWRDYVGEYAGASLDRVLYDRGLINSVAGSADFTFISSAGPRTLMHGFAFAGFDDSSVYIFECSAEASSYARWHPVFKSILKSAEKELRDSVVVNGGYRKFQDDDDVMIRGDDILDTYK